MKIVAKSICTSLVLSTLAFAGTHQNEKAAQPPESPATLPSSPSNPGTGQSNPALRIAPGTVIPVELTKGIDAKKAKSGNAVEAKVTQDLKAENGEVIVPRDTKVVGHVTEAQPRNKEQKQSQVGIAFGRAVMKNGGDISVPMSIQAIIASSGPRNNSTSASAGPAAQAPSPGGMSPGGGGGRMGNGTPPIYFSNSWRDANRRRQRKHFAPADYRADARRGGNLESEIIDDRRHFRVGGELREEQCETG